jgi:Immunity protein 8
MKAKLKEMYSLELAQPLEEFWPDDESNFGISIRLMIGSEDNSGSESFDILVCTPDWIKTQYADEKCVWGRHMLIVLEYDLELIRQEVDRYIAGCTGEDWQAIARKLSSMGAWEFEGYQP